MTKAAIDTTVKDVNETFREASVTFTDNILLVSTGLIERRWIWTGKGFLTVGLRNILQDRELVDVHPANECDWSLPDIEETHDAILLSIKAEESTDEGFTSEHLAITAEVAYPAVGINVKYVIWAYPNAAGLRTQLFLKKAPGECKFTQVSDKKEESSIKVDRGHSFLPPEMEAMSIPAVFKSFLGIGQGAIELSLEDLKPDKNYALGLTWWDHNGQGRYQSVKLSSIDGERTEAVLDNIKLPESLGCDTAIPAQIVVHIPEGLNIDGTVKMKIENPTGFTSISEVWLYEEDEEDKTVTCSALSSKREAEIKTVAPDGFQLLSYLNCGAQVATNSGNADLNRVDFLPVKRAGRKAIAIGYNNDTQNRHRPETHLLSEDNITDSIVPWASIICLEDDESGIMMLKESHKCPNQSGVNTGEFIIDESGISNTGMLISLTDLKEDRYRSCWASWTIVYDANEDARALALKQFDRCRYPIRLSRDMYIKTDTWGSGNGGRESRNKGMEVEVLKELDVVADLGLDGLQIDDGWQQSAESNGAMPDGGIGWKPHPENYPNGWRNVRAKADKLGLRIGLWAISEAITLEELKWNYDQVGFWTWKLDFANMSTPDKIEENLAKVREFISYTNHEAEVAWDVTERTPRYGYFWVREYGCMWLSNRKPNFPESVIPKPWLMLRENWELAKYANLNKFQLPIQNFARVNRDKSDAYKHSHSYEVALGLMGIPVFFQTTYLYDNEARDEIRELIALYKRHREEMFTAYVFPIGDEPTNASWAGFLWYHPERNSGYLMIFRELNNQDVKKNINLHFLAGKKVKLIDIRNEEERCLEIDHDGNAVFSIEHPADFIFCRYEELLDI